MGAGSQLAAERDRWPFRWQVTDLEAEAESLLRVLAVDEDLLVVVPAELHPRHPGAPSGAGLVALTGHRLLVVGRALAPGAPVEGPDETNPTDPSSVTAHWLDAPGWDGAGPLAAGWPATGELALGPVTVRVELDDDARQRLHQRLSPPPTTPPPPSPDR
ncbi:MAG: hypothetical protein JWM47_1997 [Acidimicrobiales bacterium]|nr:hypothetical protein [Acidimicrobiales bacterium]